jgi:dolichol-phosphate mannosyltransferase
MKLSVVMPVYNEESTVEAILNRVLQAPGLLEIIVVDDASTDRTAQALERVADARVRVFRHAKNRGKGAALRTGFAQVHGEVVVIQDADLEYDPKDYPKLLGPIEANLADVVYGSRFTGESHRVLYYWHYVGNRFLTTLSNMFTNLNLTDMETCYKAFRRSVIQSIEIEENRFGFEPEVVAKIAQQRLRIYEMGISYRGRTYAEGKKIGMKDGWRALYCILKYNLPKVPIVIQFFFYTFIGGFSAIVNLLLFLTMRRSGVALEIAAPTAFFIAAFVNYYLSVKLLFRHKAKWRTATELLVFLGVVVTVGIFDYYCTRFFVGVGFADWVAKCFSTAIGLVLNFAGRRFIVFPEKSNPDWKPQSRE